MKRLKPTQKLRVIISGIGIYTTVKQIRNGLFGFYNQNAAAQKALESLEFSRSLPGAAESCATGLAGQWEGLRVQIDLI